MPAAELLFFLLPFLFIAFGYAIGTMTERSHLHSLETREADLADILVTDIKNIPDLENVRRGELVMGEAVIATDYFKSFAAGLRNLVGGEVKSLEILVTRARREATVRMLVKARHLGATEVHNIRFETSNVMSRRGKANAIAAEVFAFGTAVVR